MAPKENSTPGAASVPVNIDELRKSKDAVCLTFLCHSFFFYFLVREGLFHLLLLLRVAYASLVPKLAMNHNPPPHPRPISWSSQARGSSAKLRSPYRYVFLVSPL